MTGSDVTVVIPVYNSSSTIVKTLDSVYAQSEKPGKIIIVNDGSKDNSKDIIDLWINEHKDISCLLLNQENGGVSKARNNGILHSQTPLTAFLDSDDLWEKTKLQDQTALYNQDEELVLSGTGSNLRPITDSIIEINRKSLLKRNLFVTSSVVCKTEILKRYLFNTELKRSEDYNLWLKIVFSGNKACILNKKLVFYTLEGSKLSSNLKALEKDELKQFSLLHKEKFITLPELIFAKILSFAKYIKRRIRHSPYGVKA